MLRGKTPREENNWQRIMDERNGDDDDNGVNWCIERTKKKRGGDGGIDLRLACLARWHR